MLGNLLQDVRFGVRSLRRSPGFTITAALTLALGIGLATAVFTVADALLLRRLPVVDQGRVPLLAGDTPDGRTKNFPLGIDAAADFARRTTALSRVATVTYEGATPFAVREGDRITRIRRAIVSGNYFDVLGSPAILGRTLAPDDDMAGATPVMVLSHRLWQERYGGDAGVIGRRIVAHDDGAQYTIVGVMPQGLDYPRGTDTWVPMLAAIPAKNRQFVAVHVVGRLATGTTREAARTAMSSFFRRDGATEFLRDLQGTAASLPELVLGDKKPAVLAFAAAAALLLLITCINVANLLLLRGLARAREVAVRSALGASRARIVRGLLAEHGVLTVVGGVLGLGVAFAAVRGFVAFAPADLPRLDEIAVDGTALLGAAGITALAMLLFSLAPALLSTGADRQESLRAGAAGTATRRTRAVTDVLVAGQVALALLVLSSAALIGRSLVNLERADLSFEPARLMMAELAVRADRYDTPQKQLALLARILPVVAGIPGVVAVSPVVSTPYAGSGWDGTLSLESQLREQAAGNPLLNMELVAPPYFATLGLGVRRGRAFTDADRDGAPPVIMLSESAAAHYWPGADPIGKRLTMGAAPRQRAFTVVGIVPDTRYRDLREARASVYFPLLQSFFPFAPTTLAIRTSGEPQALAGVLRRVLAEAEPDLAVVSAAPFASFLAKPLAGPRLNAFLLALFAMAAVSLAAIGLFGTLAAMVRQRTRELGVRMALGATATDVGRLVMRRGLMLATVGLSIGLAGALAANRALSALLFDVNPTDVPTLAVVSLVLLAIAALASAIPARTSARIEPAVALQAD